MLVADSGNYRLCMNRLDGEFVTAVKRPGEWVVDVIDCETGFLVISNKYAFLTLSKDGLNLA